jgi:hypothetical protein
MQIFPSLCLMRTFEDDLSISHITIVANAAYNEPKKIDPVRRACANPPPSVVKRLRMGV